MQKHLHYQVNTNTLDTVEKKLNEFHCFRFIGNDSTALASKHSVKSLQCRISEALTTIVFRATIFVTGRVLFLLLKDSSTMGI